MPAAIAVPAALGAAALGSGVAGSIMGQNSAGKAQNTIRTGQQQFLQLNPPDVDAMKIQLQQLQDAGKLTPEMAQAFLQGPNAMQNIQTDPRLQKAQMDALSQYANISNMKGLDPAAQAALLQAQNSNAAVAQGARGANLQNAAARGVAGGGLEFTSNQMADQNAANSNQMAGVSAAAIANQRQMDALANAANLGGQMQGTQFNQQAQTAQAQNDINRFNSLAQQQVGNQNVQAQNAAQQYNLQNAQNIANANVQQNNQQQIYNKQLSQQDYQNQLAKAQGASGLTGQLANSQLNAGAQLQNSLGGIGQGLLGAGASIYGNQNKQKYDANGNLIS